MARELARTIKSFSPSMQQGVDAEDYELIVVDNGSARFMRRQTHIARKLQNSWHGAAR